jgi:regulator of RNase E activity RraA
VVWQEVFSVDARTLTERLAGLPTAQLADACIRLGVPVRCGPAGLRPVRAGHRLAGRVAPTRHAGSVDVFLEALEQAAPGDVLVVDNGGRLDESCVGDLVVLEATAAGLAGIVIWGLHRDTADIQAIGLPVFSLGSIPTGPVRLDDRPPAGLESAQVGSHRVGSADLVVADDDGVLFLPTEPAEELVAAAERIRDTERGQAERMRAGISLRQQVNFDAYLSQRAQRPSLTFREHLRGVRGAIEE